MRLTELPVVVAKRLRPSFFGPMMRQRRKPEGRVADIFVSYTSSDRDWAFWIGQQLEALGHVARVHEWEISAGGNIPAWMEERHHKADHVLLVVSQNYLTKDYSNWERYAAEWASVSKRPNFAWPVFIEPCDTPTLLTPFKRCDLYGLSEVDARARLAGYVTPAAKPDGPVPFPGGAGGAKAPTEHPAAVAFPGQISNIPIAVPLHFLGRDDAISKSTRRWRLSSIARRS